MKKIFFTIIHFRVFFHVNSGIEDGEEYYYYETGIYTKLKDRISMLEPKLFFAYLLEVFEQVASYLLELDHLKLDLESMFLDKENRPVLCYLPEYEKRLMSSFVTL